MKTIKEFYDDLEKQEQWIKDTSETKKISVTLVILVLVMILLLLI